MPAPRSLARFNRRFLNRLTLKVAGQLPGFAIVKHTGRKSGRIYRVPVNAFRTDDGYLIALTYGPESDWVKNVLAAGSCEMQTRGRCVRLSDPRIETDESKSWAPPPVRFALDRIDAPQYMRLSLDTQTRGGPGMITSTAPDSGAAEAETTLHTTCCIVGGGPAGAVLGLLLARKGLDVTLLESHHDFDREFRGDTLHPSVMEIMAELGLADKLLGLRHNKISSFTLQTTAGDFTPVDLSRLDSPYPYITMMPQKNFLEFITEEAGRYPNFRLVMGAKARELVEADGTVYGVRYESDDGRHEVRARLTVGADGRGSRIRKLAGFEPIKTSPPMDVLWFRLPREEGDRQGALGRFGRGHIAIMLDRFDYWQAGYVIPKGTFPELRKAGIEKLRENFAALAPEMADRVEHLQDWKQASLLSVESSRCERWYRPGLLLIGDAAHVMSPVAGVGINYAIQDAVAAANILSGPLSRDEIRTKDLAAVQRRREWPTRFIQRVQAVVQRNILAPTLETNEAFTPPAPVRLLLNVPLVRSITARIVAYGLWPVHVKE